MYLESLAEQTANKVFIRFPSMVGEVLEVVSSVLQRERDRAKKVAEALIESEQGYLFTNDNDYITNRTDIIPVRFAAFNSRAGPARRPAERHEPAAAAGRDAAAAAADERAACEAKVHLDVRERTARAHRRLLQPRDPLGARQHPQGNRLLPRQGLPSRRRKHELLLQDKIQFELYAHINKNEKIAEILGEHPAITAERNTLDKSKEVLKKSLKVLQRDPE